MSISVIINTHNDSAHLDRVLESVKDFDEIVVCDMESTDETVAIAKARGCRVLTFPKGNHTCYEPACNFAIHQARSEWVLVVDADEIVPSALRRYLYHYVNGHNPASGLYIPRRNYIMDASAAPHTPTTSSASSGRNVSTGPLMCTRSP